MAPPTRPTAAVLAALGAAVVGAPSLGVLAAAPASAAEPTTWTVPAGQTLGHAALATGTSVEALAGANGIADPRVVVAGTTLTIPGTPAAPTAHVVAPGDSLSGIALRAGSSVAALAAANGIPAPYLIVEGQQLTIPASTGTSADASPEAAPPQAPGPVEVVVRRGDTLSALASAAGVPLSALLASSDLPRGAVLQPGQVVTLPTDAQAARVESATKPVASTFAGRSYPASVTAAATANRDALLARTVPSRDQVREIVAQTARDMGVDPALAQAVAHQESGFNARAVSPANAVGAMQVIPTSAEWASDLVGRDLDLLDPRDNAVAGVAILRSLTATAGDADTAIGGYYQGLRSVREDGPFADTVRYVANVTTLAARYR